MTTVKSQNAEKMPTIANADRSKKVRTIQTCFCVISVATNQVNCINKDFFSLKVYKNLKLPKS